MVSFYELLKKKEPLLEYIKQMDNSGTRQDNLR